MRNIEDTGKCRLRIFRFRLPDLVLIPGPEFAYAGSASRLRTWFYFPVLLFAAPIAVRFPNVTLTSAQWSPGGGFFAGMKLILGWGIRVLNSVSRKKFFAATGHNFEAPMNDRLILVIGTAFGDVSILVIIHGTTYLN